MNHPAPSHRPLVALLGILLMITLFALIVVAVADTVIRWPVLVQAIFYLVLGIVWIFPLRPLVRWSQQGREPPRT